MTPILTQRAPVPVIVYAQSPRIRGLHRGGLWYCARGLGV